MTMSDGVVNLVEPNDEKRHDGSDKSNNDRNLTKKAAQGTIVTILMRLISFVCTQRTYRLIADPAILGSANISLELLLSTILFLSREGFRLVLLSSSSSRTSSPNGKSDNIKINNSDDTWNLVSWCTIPVTTIFTFLALLWHFYKAVYENINSSHTVDYQIAGVLYCVAACIEGYGEPAVLVALRDMNVTTKALAEGIAVMTKTVSLPILLSFSVLRTYPVCCFGLSQLAYSLVYTSFLYWNVYDLIHLPHILTKSKSSFNITVLKNHIKNIGVFTGQGLIKHVLTEGDRIVLTMLAASYDQGVYAMGSSYGGLAARLLLQPLEENARLLWSRIIASSSPTQTTEYSNDESRNVSFEVLTLLRSSYVVLVKMVLYIGCIFSCLAVNYTKIVLVVLAGRTWGNSKQASTVLSGFCLYTAFLAWNGMTEAFVYAVLASSSSASSNDKANDKQKEHKVFGSNQLTRDMAELSLAHTVVGCIFALVAFIAVGLYGTIGLVTANCIAMGIRALYAVSFAARYFLRQMKVDGEKVKNGTALTTFLSLLREMFPRPLILVAFLFAFYLTRISFQKMEAAQIDVGTISWYTAALQHVSVGIACAAGVGGLAYTTEREFRKLLISLWRGKRSGVIQLSSSSDVPSEKSKTD